MQTTLNKIKSHSPCENGWKKLLNHLGKTESDDEPLELRTILESNGIDDTLWAFRAVEGKDKEIRLFAADCAELVLPIYEKQYPNDDRPRKAIQAARDYANELISAEKLVAASDDAAEAASEAAWAVASVAWAASHAAWHAASDTAAWAAELAAWNASRAAAYAKRAAEAAELAASEAAWAVASVAWAARAAELAASDAAWDALDAARDARDAAWAAARAAASAAAWYEIKSLLLKYI